MIHSLLMLGSAYNKNRKISIIFLITWLIYMFLGSNLSLGIKFPIINAIVFIAITFGINLIKNRRANTILSVFSILIWSIIIDIICYFLYPSLVGNQNIFAYIFQGILFNYRYVFANILALGIVNIGTIITKKICKSMTVIEKEKVLQK